MALRQVSRFFASISAEFHLSEEEQVVAVHAINHAGLALQAQLRYVEFPVVQKLERQADDVLLAQRQVR